MRKTRILIAAAAVLATVTGGLTLTSRNDIAEAAVVWHDDFDGAAGTGVDTSKWNFDTGGGGWGNQELEYYTSGTNNVAKDGQGHLVITARRQTGNSCWYGTCTWTSGRIQTAGKFTQQYGHIEARIQVPDGQGLWPAFWMLGGSNWPNDGEIDIMEVVGRQPNTLYGTLHGPGYSGGNGYGATRNSSTPYWQAFHTYAIDWSPNLIIWRVDGSEFFRATPESLRAAKGNVSWVYNHGFFIIMNLAVGGNFGGTVGNLPTENRMVIDYVHVDTSSSGPTTPPTTTPPAGGSVLRSASANRCIDIPGANPVDAVRLQIYDCNGTGAQQWALRADGTAAALGKCMDAAAAGTANGTRIQLYTCNGTGAQKFALNASGQLVNSNSGKCVDVVNNGTGNGSLLQLWTCTGGANQRWTRS